MKLVKIKNTGVVGTWVGQTILSSEYHTLENESELYKWEGNEAVYNDIANGRLVINNGIDTVDDMTPFDGWKWLSSTEKLPISNLDGVKLAVHTSSKPYLEGKTTYAVWTGSGDNAMNGMMCDGDILEFDLVPGKSEHAIEVKHDQAMNGRVWIHEGYLKFEGGGSGDYVDATVVAMATPLQTAVNLDLIITDNWITYSVGGAGTGTHGFADAAKIVLVPRPFSRDGDWDYDGTNLTPNFTNTGGYKMSDIERIVSKYMNKLPCRGTCNNFFSMTSDDTSELLQNYFIRITAHNVSNTTWFATAIIEIFRERTFNP